jgi:hypothetical protein
LVDDLVAFLESLVELPVDFTRVLSFGVHCPGGAALGPVTAVITNISTNTITITNVAIAGTNAANFQIISDTGETNLLPGQTRSIQVSFTPTVPGMKKATLEITALDTNLLGRFDFGIALEACGHRQRRDEHVHQRQLRHARHRRAAFAGRVHRDQQRRIDGP